MSIATHQKHIFFQGPGTWTRELHEAREQKESGRSWVWVLRNGRQSNQRVTEVHPKESQLPKEVNKSTSMHLDEPSMKDSLLRMIGRITPNFALRQDLLQEALIHLWLMETRRPGQTKSWYLQSCKFHLRHYLASGRSVDSAKRAGGHTHSESNLGEGEDLELPDPGPSVLTLVSALDLVSV